jgi:hypothetical protein
MPSICVVVFAVLPMITAMAPACSAFLTLAENGQAPRSISATLPFRSFVNGGVQPLVVDVSGPSMPSAASTTSPEVPVGVTGGPKYAGPAVQSPAIAAGRLIRSMGRGRSWALQVPTVRGVSGVSVPAPLRRSTTSPHMSEYDSFNAPGCHW